MSKAASGWLGQHAERGDYSGKTTIEVKLELRTNVLGEAEGCLMISRRCCVNIGIGIQRSLQARNSFAYAASESRKVRQGRREDELLG